MGLALDGRMHQKPHMRQLTYEGEVMRRLFLWPLEELQRLLLAAPLRHRAPARVQARLPRSPLRSPVTNMRPTKNAPPFLGLGFQHAPVWFARPSGVAVGANGGFVVADAGRSQVLRFSASGRLLGCIDHTHGGRLPLQRPVSVALTECGEILVLDSGAGMIHRYDTRGRHLQDLVPDLQRELIGAQGLCVGPWGVVFVCATRAQRVLALDLDGTRRRDLETADLGSWAFASPRGVAQSRAGDIAVCDTQQHRVDVFDAAGFHRYSIGQEGRGVAQFEDPIACAYGTGELLLVVERGGDRVQTFDPGGRVRASWGSGGDGEREPGDADALCGAEGVAVDRHSGEVLIADTRNRRIQRLPLADVCAGLRRG
jgi:hypothetical protein